MKIFKKTDTEKNIEQKNNENFIFIGENDSKIPVGNFFYPLVNNYMVLFYLSIFRISSKFSKLI